MKAAKTLLIAALSTLTPGSGYGDDLDRFPAIAAAEIFSWLGYYSQPSERCTEPATNAKCADQFRDQFKTEPWNQRYKVDLLGLGVCGAHADIDGLTFPLASQCLHECHKPTR